MKRKLIALCATALLVLSLAACGAPGTTESLDTLTLPGTESASAASGTESSQAEPEEVELTDMADCTDDLDGLCKYLEGNFAVAGARYNEMSIKEIGAADGTRYRFVFSGGTVQVELYEFDLANLDDKAKACIGSVETSGSFTVLDNQVPATLSDNGKYLMIYTDTRNDEAATAQKEAVTKLFRGFKA